MLASVGEDRASPYVVPSQLTRRKLSRLILPSGQHLLSKALSKETSEGGFLVSSLHVEAQTSKHCKLPGVEENERRKERSGTEVQEDGGKARRRLVTKYFSATFECLLCQLLQTSSENVNSLHFQQLTKV